MKESKIQPFCVDLINYSDEERPLIEREIFDRAVANSAHPYEGREGSECYIKLLEGGE